MHIPPANLLGLGLVDEHGIAGSRGVVRSWQELDVTAPGNGRVIRELFGRTDATFRRIDLPAKALVLACEAADVAGVLTADEREAAAICIETDVGSLKTDQAFAASLDDDCVHAGIFPYSLTSTCLGEIALRYELRGATVSMSVRRGTSPPGAGLREALRMLASGDARHVVTGAVDVQTDADEPRTPRLRATIAVLANADDERTANPLGTISWPAPDEDPYRELAQRYR